LYTNKLSSGFLYRKCYQIDKRWATNSRKWNRRVCRNLIMGKMNKMRIIV